MNKSSGKRPLYLLKCLTDRVKKVPIYGFLDQVSEHFCVCFRFKHMSAPLQFVLEVKEILDDAVMDDSQRLLFVDMRMCISFIRLPMGCPPGMPNTDRATHWILAQTFVQFPQFPSSFPEIQLSITDNSDTR
jgi:hypothetical protein